MSWVREPVGNGGMNEMENVFRFRHGAVVAERCNIPVVQEDGSSALQLVQQLAEVIQGKEDHASEVEARAQALAQAALDELKRAESRLRSSEIARNVAEAEINEVAARADKFDRTLRHLESRVAIAEAELYPDSPRTRRPPC
jgi:chromosome segregation ATPase